LHGRAAFLLFAILAASGCRRAGPDANFQKALGLYQQLYATQLDDAYGDPQMDEVVALLKKVDSRSLDAQPATTLLGTIERGREALAADRARREKMAAAAGATVTTPSGNIDPVAFLAANQHDAGPAQDPYGPGATVSEINAATGGCLSGYEPFTEKGTSTSGIVYRVVPTSACADKLPGYVGQAVLVINGRVYRRIPDPNPQAMAPTALATPDAGPATAARPPAAAPVPDAGAPEPQYYYPGQPRLGATPPPPTDQQR
jgi:hypothetical protein